MMWHVTIVNAKAGNPTTIINFPAKTEDQCFEVLEVLRKVYPDVATSLTECAGQAVCAACG